MNEPSTAAAAPDPARPKGALGIIFLIVFTDLLGFGIIIPLLPFYAKFYDASALQVTLLFSVYSVFQLVGSPILGVLSDRIGRRPILIFSQLGSVLGYVLLGIVTHHHWNNLALALSLIYLSRIIDGFTGGNISTAQAYISDVTPPQDRAKGMGVLGAAFGIGFTLGPALGGLLGDEKHNAAYPAYAAAAFSAAAMCLTYFRLPEPARHRPDESSESWLHPRNFLPILARPAVRGLLLISFVSMAAFVMLESTVALYLKDTLDFGPRQVGYYFGFIGLVICLVQGGLIGRLTKALGEWPLNLTGALFVALGMMGTIAVAYHPLIWVLLIGGALNACGRSLQTPTLFSLISKATDPREQGAVFGLNSSLSSLGRAIGPAVAGAAYARHITAPYQISGAMMLAVLVWTLWLRSRYPVAKVVHPATPAANPTGPTDTPASPAAAEPIQ